MRADLQRFLDAQAGIYDAALAELRRGRKTGHWMWFVFPQIAGLGASATSVRYAIRDLAEAEAYLAHPLLGARLAECTEAVLAHAGVAAEAVFGYPDVLKFRSCMTLFECVAAPGNVFSRALEMFYAGQRDERTLALLGVEQGR